METANRRPLKNLLRTFYRPWYRRAFPWLLMLVLPVLIAGRLALTPLAEREAHRVLDKIEGYDVRFSGIDIFLSPLVVVVNRVAVYKQNVPRSPLLTARRLEIFLNWNDLLHDQHTVSARLDHPVLVPHPGAEVDLQSLFAQLPPARIELLTIDAGTIVLASTHADPMPWLSAIEANAKGLVTRRSLDAGDTHAVIEGQATLLRTGRMNFRFNAQPWDDRPNLRGDIAVENLSTADLEQLPRLDNAIPSNGRDNCTIEAAVRVTDGALTGLVRAGVTDTYDHAGMGPALVRTAATFANIAPGVEITMPAANPGADSARLTGALVPASISTIDSLLGVTRGMTVEGLLLALPVTDETDELIAAQ